MFTDNTLTVLHYIFFGGAGIVVFCGIFVATVRIMERNLLRNARWTEEQGMFRCPITRDLHTQSDAIRIITKRNREGL